MTMRVSGSERKWITIRALLVMLAVVGLLLSRVATHVSSAATQPPAGQEEFVPIDQLPQDEELPAAPLVIGAYAIAWLAVFAYMWSLWQRTTRVERDLAELSRRVQAGGERR